jgi:glycosyltransferase involved in cell wall biosynthesis
MADISFHGKLAVQQRVLTPYRAAFFDKLAEACDGGLSVFAGSASPTEGITPGELKTASYTPAANLHFPAGPFSLYWQKGLLSWLESWNPDALIMEANPRYLSTLAAVRWMKRRQRPVIGWGLGAPALTGISAGLRGNRRLAFIRHFDALLTYSCRGADEYTRLGISNDRITVAPNATAPRPTQPLPIRPAKPDGKATVLFVGRLQVRKRVDLLLRACAGLPVDLQPRLIIVGDGPEREALERLAKKIYPSAEFPGSKHGNELAVYFNRADLFALPGTGGLAVQEAMSHGLPVIMGQGDGTNDDLVRPENGWQISDPESLQTILREALTDTSRLRKMGAESYRIVAEEINLEKMVEVFIEAVNQAVARENPARTNE